MKHSALFSALPILCASALLLGCFVEAEDDATSNPDTNDTNDSNYTDSTTVSDSVSVSVSVSVTVTVTTDTVDTDPTTATDQATDQATDPESSSTEDPTDADSSSGTDARATSDSTGSESSNSGSSSEGGETGAEWTCPAEFYDDNVCDCGCGVFDALGCMDATISSCLFCESEGGCSDMPCTYNTEIDPNNNAVCL